METLRLNADESARRLAAEALRAGQVVAVPTETVYGLAADATRPAALKGIYAAKQRPLTNPLIAHVGPAVRSLQDLEDRGWAGSLPSAGRGVADRLISAFWPGSLTLVLPRGRGLPPELSAGLATVGFRQPASPWLLSLLDRLDFPLAAPSANRSNRLSPTEAAHVEAELGGRIPLIIDGGRCSRGLESTIVRISEDGGVELLRPGAIPALEIENVVGHSLSLVVNAPAPLSPGMLKIHYAPVVPLCLTDSTSCQGLREWLAHQGNPTPVGVLVLFGPPTCPRPWRDFLQSERVWSLRDKGEGIEAAHALYGTLREMESSGLKAMVVERPTRSTGLWPALSDRLQRASTKWATPAP